MKNKLFFLLLSLFLACDQAPQSADSAVPQASEPAAKAETGSRSPEEPTADGQRKLIKEGEVAFETDDLAATTQRIKTALTGVDGYISQERESKGGDRIYYFLQVRVPADRFDAFLAQISEGVDYFERKEIRTRDVTEEYLDLSARLKSKRAVEARFLEILDRAATIEEVLSVEERIAGVRLEIERLEGRIRYLDNRIGMSTLDISYYQIIDTPNPVSRSPSFGRRLGNALKNGFEGVQLFLIALANAWPLLLLGGAAFFAWRYRNKGRGHGG